MDQRKLWVCPPHRSQGCQFHHYLELLQVFFSTSNPVRSRCNKKTLEFWEPKTCNMTTHFEVFTKNYMFFLTLTCLILRCELLSGKCLHLHELSLTVALDCQITLQIHRNVIKQFNTVPCGEQYHNIWHSPDSHPKSCFFSSRHGRGIQHPPYRNWGYCQKLKDLMVSEHA